MAYGGTAVSAGLGATGQSPGASRQAFTAACRRPVKAVSTHYMALGRAATRQPQAGWAPIPPGPAPWDGLPGILVAAGRWPPVADHTLARLPRAAW
jgi:hypothetical protein